MTPPIVAPVNGAKKAADGVGIGVIDGKGVGVGGAVNVPERIVAVPFFTAIVEPAITVGTVWPMPELRRRVPFLKLLSRICPATAPFTTTSSIVFAGRFTF